jgi:hypothetical protein
MIDLEPFYINFRYFVYGQLLTDRHSLFLLTLFRLLVYPMEF